MRIRKRDGLLQKNAATIPIGATGKEVNLDAVQGTGSGVLVGRRHILTNAHVVKGCAGVRVTVDGHTTKAKILHPGDEDHDDLAVLELEYVPGFAAKFRNMKLHTGDTIVVMGFPDPRTLGQDAHLVTEAGPVTALRGAKDDPQRFQTSATINPGNSGGPLFDLNGNVAGVAVQRVKPNVLQNTYFAIKSDIARNFLEAYQLTPEIGGTEETLTVPMLEQQKRRYVVYVECLGLPAQIANQQ
jgi:S1-C subfamily serine protease